MTIGKPTQAVPLAGKEGGGASEDVSIRRYESAKQRLARHIALLWRTCDDGGEYLPPESFRDDFLGQTAQITSLSELWEFIGEPLRAMIREGVETPSMIINYRNGKSSLDYERKVMGFLDGGEHVALPEGGLTKS